MALSIRDGETDRLARELAGLTGETMTQAIRTALEERLARERRARAAGDRERFERIVAVIDEYAALPVLDDRAPDEILGYDEHGLPR